MEHVDAILWHKVGLADFKGIHSINRNGKGSSQTFAGVPSGENS